MNRLKPYFAELGLLYAAATWGSTFYILKDSLNYVDPIVLVSYRFGLSTIVLGAFLLYRRKNLLTNLKAGIILSVLVWIMYILQTIGLKYTTATNSGFITGMFVVFVPIFSFILFKKHTQLNKIVAILISLLGLWILTGGLNYINLGDILTLGTAVAYAIHVLLIDKYVKNNVDPYILVFQQFFFVAVASLLVSLVLKLHFNPIFSNVSWAIVYLALIPTVSAMLIQFVAQKLTTPIRASLIFAMEPVFAALFAWTLGGETFILHKALGGFLIVLAIIFSDVPLKRFNIQNKS